MTASQFFRSQPVPKAARVDLAAHFDKSAIVDRARHGMASNDNPASLPTALLKIAFCVPDFEPLQLAMTGQLADAAYLQQGYIAAGLQARGHRLTFVAPHNLDQLVCTSDLQKPRVALQTWSDSRWFTGASRNSWRVQRTLGIPYLNLFSNYRRFDASLQCLPGHDVVYERNSLYTIGVAMACRRLNLPYVMFFDADQIAEYDFIGRPITGLLRWRAKGLLRYNLKTARCIICVSEPAKANLLTTWCVPEEKIVVLPNAVDVQRFQPNPEASLEARALVGMGANPLIIFVGSFYEWHDVATLLHAFSQVLMDHPEARLVLVGDGQKRQTMMQHAAELGIDHAVRFTGALVHAEVPRLVAAADIAVAPYPPMTQRMWLSPLKVFEYMASGTAVIASAAGQLVEIIQDGHNGLLVPPGDASKLASAINRLLEDVSLRRRLGQQARLDAVEKHSWEQYVPRLEQVFTAM